MKTIKFRNWNGRSMEYFADLYWFEENGVHSSDQTNNVSGEINLMQFTGLLDRNGKEIYEGDICKTLYDSRYEINIPKIFTDIGYYSDEWNEYGFEVIGNIYENPELIGGRL